VQEELLTIVCESDGRGRPLRGDRVSRLRLAAHALPPVRGFWRVFTRPAASADERHGISSANDLGFDAGRSLDLIIHDRPPAVGDLANWLPAPGAEMSLVMRLYDPRDEALSRAWSLPPIEIADLDAVDPGSRPAPSENRRSNRRTPP
jgi:hypothetical protein